MGQWISVSNLDSYTRDDLANQILIYNQNCIIISLLLLIIIYIAPAFMFFKLIDWSILLFDQLFKNIFSAGHVVTVKPADGFLKSDLAKEKDDPSFSDATLICQGQKIKIHKFMLAARDDVFKTMLASQDFIEGDVWIWLVIVTSRLWLIFYKHKDILFLL